MKPDAFLTRSARLEDIDQIVHLLWDDEFGKFREENSYHARLPYVIAFREIEKSINNELLVCLQENQVIACLQITIIPGLSYSGIRRCLIEDVRVARQFQGLGIGTHLMAKAEQLAKARGCELIELFVHSKRVAAHGFYEKCGFAGRHRGFRKSIITEL